MGQRLKDEAARLLVSVENLLTMVRDANCQTAEFRIEGDPVKALDDDPFLTIVAGLQPDKKAYARLIWAEWFNNLRDKGVTIPLRIKISEQTGGDADLEAKINKSAKAEREDADRRYERKVGGPI